MYAAAAALLWLGAMSQVLAATQNIFIGLLRGLGNTASGLTRTAAGYGAIGFRPSSLAAKGWAGVQRERGWGCASLLARRACCLGNTLLQT
ncbi:hypothetical protein [Acidovorax sp. Leaf78]|uniref:hypothetical protein n=1 Tax=Acidovorax sp. Leaf78 TaxID=1736237 RepID=UPI000A97F44F|nr:hypothetical protein [Acidovorax sp. Leaf78]